MSHKQATQAVRSRNGNFFSKASRRRIDLRYMTPMTERDITVQTSVWGDRRDGIMTSADVRQTTPAPWSAATRPTHFISMKLPAHSATMQAIERLHVDTATALEQYVPLLVPRDKLHLTLSVATLADPAAQLPVLRRVVAEAAPMLRQATLRFDGLGTFGRGRVLFARPSTANDHQRLCAVVKAMRQELAAAGVDVKGNPADDYVPHLTVAKMTPALQRQFKASVVPEVVYRQSRFDDHGLTTFQRLDVCSMFERPDAEEDAGYYKVLHSESLE
jgi:2'-5' RNA ligase